MRPRDGTRAWWPGLTLSLYLQGRVLWLLEGPHLKQAGFIEFRVDKYKDIADKNDSSRRTGVKSVHNCGSTGQTTGPRTSEGFHCAASLNHNH